MPTFFAGSDVPASKLELLANPPICRLIQQSAQSFSSGSAGLLTYGTGSEDKDDLGWHDTAVNNTRVTPTIAGWYIYVVTFSMSAATAMTQLLTGVRKNGANYGPLITNRPDAASNSANSLQAIGHVPVNGTGDYIEHVGQSNFTAGPFNTNVSSGFASTFELFYHRGL